VLAAKRIAIVAPSRWMAALVLNSGLFRGGRVETIPNCVDTRVFRPIDPGAARVALGLPHNVRLVAYMNAPKTPDHHKGGHLIEQTLKRLQQICTDPIGVVSFGGSFGTPHAFDLRWDLGRLQDEFSLALVYAAADAFLAPYLQDNFPNTVLEAQACGTPCVVFDAGGMADLVVHKKTGYLARAFETDDLAAGLAWVLENPQRALELRATARARAESNWSYRVVARKHLDLYSQLAEHDRLEASVK
jgi:glycosyltransferase involved in cell wall biosynthesis